MWAFILKNLRTIGLLGIITTGLATLGVIINSFSIWNWLETFFSIIKNSVQFIDFMWDTDTTLQIIGLMMSIIIAYWTWKAIMIAISWFKH